MTRIALGCGLCLAAIVAAATLGAAAQQASPATTAHAALVEDLVAANRALVQQGVLDAWGHASARDDRNPNRYLLSRSLAPALVTAEDIMEYDLNSNPLDQRGRVMYDERFIHGEIYKARPDVRAIVHSHSPAVIPFGLTSVPLRPVFHMSFFVAEGVPVWDIRRAAGMTNMLVQTSALGRSLAETLGNRPAALLRGHGDVVVGLDVATAVGRAIFLEVNAKLQAEAIRLGGPITFMDPEEARLRERPNQYGRGWELWKRQALAR